MAKASQDVDALAQLFRILADPTRLRIVATLQNGERNVTDLCKELKTPQPTVSRHLSILRMGGLVENRRNGKEIIYSIANHHKTPSTRGLAGILKKSSAVRIGPLVLGMSKS